MRVTVHPILSFRSLVDGADFVEVPSAATLPEVLQYLCNRYHGFYGKICGDDGKIRDSVLLFVNDRQVHKENLHQIVLSDGARIMVVPSIVGG